MSVGEPVTVRRAALWVAIRAGNDFDHSLRLDRRGDAQADEGERAGGIPIRKLPVRHRAAPRDQRDSGGECEQQQAARRKQRVRRQRFLEQGSPNEHAGQGADEDDSRTGRRRGCLCSDSRGAKARHHVSLLLPPSPSVCGLFCSR